MYLRLVSICVSAIAFSMAPVAADPLQVRDISNTQQISVQASSFEKDLAYLGISAKLTCELMVGIRNQERNESFGAICDMTLPGKKPTSIMLCNDTMIGTLTIKASGFSINKSELIEFTKFNCMP
ncbi:hypothetical protein [Ochrobactrum sp. MYb379]|uniref:hypothetical protein n=1 Tax=Ochrobactrum sp. MYb379 TaxID=2745275 RepID=UPI0030AD2A00